MKLLKKAEIMLVRICYKSYNFVNLLIVSLLFSN